MMQRFPRCSPSVLESAGGQESFETQNTTGKAGRQKVRGPTMSRRNPRTSLLVRNLPSDIRSGPHPRTIPAIPAIFLSLPGLQLAAHARPLRKRALRQIMPGLSPHPQHFGHLAGRRSCATSSRTAGECHFAMPTSQETTIQGERGLRLIFRVSKLPEACTHFPGAEASKPVQTPAQRC